MTDALIADNGARWASIDALVGDPGLPSVGEHDIELKHPDGYGLARRIDLPDDGFAATFSALREYRLVPWVRTPEAMDVLLTRWLDLPIDGDDVEVAVMWPSRDVAMIPCSKAVG
ncbi:MAG TPA: hypothetical protein H9881_08020 [Candidatus Stackebrandtia excrementipullorum]|nr:hypothetical protein [Candidatus Stackebrandtia excrementipullorum]